MAIAANIVQKAYVAFFNRPADYAGLLYWSTNFTGTSLDSLLNTLSTSQEYTNLYSGMNNTAIVNQIYQNLFQRDADLPGLSHWLTKLDNKTLTLASIANGIAEGAQNADKVAFANKVTAAVAFTNALDTPTKVQNYASSTTASMAATKAWLAAITTDATLTAATTPAALSAIVTATTSTTTTGSTFTLTTGTDTFTGTASNDTFNGSVSATAGDNTLTTIDTLNGVGGTDTLNVIATVLAADIAVPSAGISNIQTVNIRSLDGDGTVGTNVASFASVSGVTAVNADRNTSNVTVTALATGGSVGMIGNGSVVNGILNYAYSTATAAQTINISGGTLNTGVASITATASAGVTSVTINSTGAANAVDTILTDSAGAGTVTSLTVNAATNLTATLTAADYAATSALTVTGAAASVVLASAGNFRTIDASALSAGGLTITLGTNMNSFKGGVGNDIVTAAQVTTVTASAVDAGSGSADRLVIATTAHVDTLAEARVFSGFDVLQVDTGVTADVALFTTSSLTSLRTAGTATINNVTATMAGAVTITANSTTTLAVVNSTQAGQVDTVRITIDDGTTGVGAVGAITLTTPSLAGVEVLNMVANDGFTIGALTSATALTNLNVTGAGNISITTGAVAFATNFTIDASAATGTSVITGAAATTNGVSIKGSIGGGTLTGGVSNDVIVGGAAADTITGGDGQDTMTGGAGADTFAFGAADMDATPSGTVFEVITDFAKSSDIIDHTVGALVIVNGSTASSGVAAVAATGLATFNAADNTLALRAIAVEAGINASGAAAVRQFAFFEFSTDSYVLISDGTDGLAATDTLIKLTGVTGLTASDLVTSTGNLILS